MKNNHNVLTIGDAMITMNPASRGPLRFVSHFERKIGGAELNFAIACARLNLSSTWISRLGKDEFGRHIHNFARGEGINTNNVKLMEGYPTSINFKEINEDGSGRTFYYRHDSPILTLTTEDIRGELFDDVSVIHLTGVYMAIDKKNLEIVYKIIDIAKDKNIPISFDPNIRLKLWDIKDAREAYNTIFPHVDILLTGLDEIELITGISSETDLELFAKKNNISELVIKDGGNGSRLYTGNQWFYQDAFPVKVVDTVGAGDGFDAGYVYSYLHNKTAADKLKFANAVGAFVTTVSGDNEGLPYLEDVENYLSDKKVVER
ncbi:sugar kinase [Virgibacillus sp. C22-A2]|uniref:Sugar kinase n=1 Tax=Virgibacillus tibetensis TaxID=3042313 RepID=A0ABU6KGU3_9BACI|nr:sugar kinase [Virgibacillus sp. C22-A2]